MVLILMDFLRHCMILIYFGVAVVGMMVAAMKAILGMIMALMKTIVGMMMVLLMSVSLMAVKMMFVMLMLDFNLLLLIALMSDTRTYSAAVFFLQRFKSFGWETVISVVHLLLFGPSVGAFL